MSKFMSRRNFIVTGGAAAALLTFPGKSVAAPAIHVVKDPNCGCCSAWIEILEADGFSVTTQNLAPADLALRKLEAGIPQTMMSCHTGEIGGYVIEGHVPAADIHRLLEARPDAIGLAVPGMPYGSPGMGPEEAREAYDVFLLKRDGTVETYSSYASA
jgi:hypothetical protein